jgi:RNA polymerase sigma-70 factor (ECF subfamily)
LHPDIPYTDTDLFTLIAEGDEAAFNNLYRRYIPILVPFLRKFTRADVPADEIIQETFIRLWLGRDKLPEIEQPRSWIFKIASHVAFSWLKKDLRYQQVVSNMHTATAAAGQHDAVNEHLHLLETRRLIQQAVNSLSGQRKKIYLLSREQGLTIPAIAEQLQLSPNTVKNALVRALADIRQHLQQAGYQLPLLLLILLT